VTALYELEEKNVRTLNMCKANSLEHPEVVTYLVNEKGRLLKTVETGGIVGEMAIAAGRERTANVQTVSDCTLMKLNAADYLDFYQQSPSLQAAVHNRKLVHIAETRSVINDTNMIEGDDICEHLLKNIWQTE